MSKPSSLPSQEEMAAYDQATIVAGTSGVVLMERAGKAMFEHILATEDLAHGVLIFCGTGNNGGDGLVIARHLAKARVNHQVVVASAVRHSAEFIIQAQSYLNSGGKILGFGPDPFPSEVSPVRIISLPDLERLLSESALCLDALLGTGQRRAPSGPIATIIATMNRIRAKVIAIDQPTGVNGSSGEVYQPVVRAIKTLTVELVKRGLLQYPARNYCGEIITVKIGIDTQLPAEFTLIGPDQIGLSGREPASHKGDYGSVLVIGSSRNMPGASILAAHGALRVGAGLVTKVHMKGTPFGSLSPEVILREVDDQGLGFLGQNSFEAIFEGSSRFNAVVIGPGLGTDPETANLIRQTLIRLRPTQIPVVVDADALNFLAKEKDKASLLGANFVLTPHPGEAARLLQIESAEINRDRFAAVKKLSQQTGSIVVLKGAGTLVYFDGAGAVNSSGNPYMASAGVGDVLSGVIAGLIAQGLSPFEAAKVGVYLHGRAGDLAHVINNGPVIASDLVGFLPEAIGELIAEDVE